MQNWIHFPFTLVSKVTHGRNPEYLLNFSYHCIVNVTKEREASCQTAHAIKTRFLLWHKCNTPRHHFSSTKVITFHEFIPVDEHSRYAKTETFDVLLFICLNYIKDRIVHV